VRISCGVALYHYWYCKLAEREGKVLLVDGSDLFRKGRNQNTLEVEHVFALLAAYEDFGTIAGRASVVSIEEITAQGGNLNLAGNIAKVDDEVIPSVAEATRFATCSA
jgi:type I restriction enzyme M protein